MKRISRILGVTLLEIMLVLAIAAMIIVMSIRYYQSASASQQANTVLQSIQAITAAADSLGQASGSYSGLTSASTSLGAVLPATAFTLPYGGKITVSSTGGAGAATVTMSLSPQMPASVCGPVTSRLKQNNHYTTATCSSVVYTPGV